ncbi:large conductance mechanosensitive channel protein MscL [Calothrix sp. NIES-3974]|uniref:large conductance mechanosensitive channel protein MscL n=1 Tax=Calothrix sp. NIES-3974 TaxID=2005462 RepID=UPI000B60C4E3|nr:large conductance mechanosensitive channel protein MscL [Calothrix sp. NIES-3974]BAZ06514.1 large conductance mechanosensitive channel protein [Calothrix sp. NIES-3974]
MARARRNSFLRDFQEFALKGNVVDLAVGVIIGAAFGKIVSSLVDNVIMPLINPVLAAFGNDWRNWAIGATEIKDGIPQNGIRIGLFLGSIVDFLIVALVLFIAIQAIQKLKRKEEVEAAAEPTPPDPAIVAQERLTAAIEQLDLTMRSRQV